VAAGGFQPDGIQDIRRDNRIGGVDHGRASGVIGGWRPDILEGVFEVSITSKQWFQIISGINGGLITGAALLQTLFGQDLTLKIVAVLGIIGIIINSVGTALSGADSQDTQVKRVLAMPGVEPMQVNAKASPELAKLAMDRSVDKIGPAPDQAGAVAAIAKAAA
jgi:hypothetical protein